MPKESKPTPATNAPNGAVFARIRSLIGSRSFRPSEVAVARLALEHADEVVNLPVEQLAKRAEVSTTTVLRFCQALGFRGFKDFKIELARELGGAPALLPTALEPGSTPMEIARTVLQSEVQALRDTFELLDEAALDAAVEALARAKRIEIYGMGSSVPVVLDAYYRLLRIGLNVATPPDSHMQSVNASLLSADDVVLIVSHTGRTQEILATAKLAREAGAKVIALTSFLKSPLVDSADIALVTAVKETASRVEAMASRLAHLYIVDVLYIALAAERLDEANASLQRTQRAIDEQRADFDTLQSG